jgi:oxygen-dependent protoporphyrinogen oxidase
MKTGLLSTSGKLRLLAELFIRPRRSDEEESVFSFASRRIGREAAERLVASFVSGIYAGDAEALSVQAAFPSLASLETNHGGLIRGAIAKAREARRKKKSSAAVLEKAAPTRRRLVSFRRGMSFLTDTLAAAIGEDVMTGCGDCRVLTAKGEDKRSAAFQPGEQNQSLTVSFERDGRREELKCDRLVIAAPSNAAASLIAPLSEDLSRMLREISYPPLTIVYLAYDRSAIKSSLNGFGFLAVPTEGLKILGCVWNSSLFEGRAPAGKVLFTVFIGGARNPAAAQFGDAEIVSNAHTELRRVLGISGEPDPVAITRYQRAIPQYNLGHAQRVRGIESKLKEIPEVRLIGNYLHGVSTGDCIKEADRVARELNAEYR